MSNVIIQTQHGAFCAVCQSLLSMEEEDFGVCDACDGEGIGGDDDDYSDIAEAEEALADPGERITLDAVKAKLQN